MKCLLIDSRRGQAVAITYRLFHGASFGKARRITMESRTYAPAVTARSDLWPSQEEYEYTAPYLRPWNKMRRTR